MNVIYMGKCSDDNIGNGKTVSAVGRIVDEWLEDENRVIYSNIKLKEVPYTLFSPENIEEVLETDFALVLLDELHAIVHKNHKIGESCKKHGENIGLCYRLSEFFRQIRKRKSDTYSTCQTFADAHFQFRTLMQQQIVCEKFNLQNNKLYKCDGDKCPEDHRHYIKQSLFRNYNFVKELSLFDPEPYYPYYCTGEIVAGWVNYD